jgi:hypothetical protein
MDVYEIIHKEHFMDHLQFDGLARRLGTTPPRRKLLAGLAGGLAGLVGLGTIQDDADAKRRKRSSRERDADQKQDAPQDEVAAEGRHKKKKKVCAAGLTRCRDVTVAKKSGKKKKKKTVCIDSQTDTSYCGGCGRVCAPGETCVGGSCKAAAACQTASQCTNPMTSCQERTCTNGVCGVRPLSQGTPCDDGSACATGETCDGNGACSGGTPVACPNAPSECQISDGATCDPETGQCSYPAKPDNTPCGMNRCNHTCQSGQCTNTRVVCPGDNSCQTSTCDPNDGTCSTPTPIVCPTAPECQTGAGVCDPQSGTCAYTSAPNNTPCGMNKCNRTCQEGVCERTPVVCPTPNECQASVCDPNDGTCSAPMAANQGNACKDGAGMCVDGTCEVTNAGSTTCTGANPCLVPTFCNQAETCLCYSTIEGAGFCIDKGQAVCPAADVRPACASSDECSDSEVCVPLKETPESTTSCCGNGGQFPGFCVPLSARCS